MADDTYYLTPHESALAVVATSMKKARLKLDTLIINSIIGGMLFTSGGMLHVIVQASPDLVEHNPGIIHMLQGLVYPIGLFYVVIMGAELFNSNVLFFTVGLLRGAVGPIDLIINWFLSWIFNLGANIFVCYVICFLSGALTTEVIKTASIDIMVEKAKSSFIETFIKAIACNFYVSLAIYLQIMCKPLHVKFLMMILPVFTFVAMGFSHTVADMFLCPMGLMNGAPVKVKLYIWKVLISETLGNIVGGSFFAVVIPYYQHLIVVERDRNDVGLPGYDARDEQPELMMDSRVIRKKSGNTQEDDLVERVLTRIATSLNNNNNSIHEKNDLKSLTSTINSSIIRNNDNDIQSYDSEYLEHQSRKNSQVRSPKGVFPVDGMGEPLEREKTIASGFKTDSTNNELKSVNSRKPNNDTKSIISRKSFRDNDVNDVRNEYLSNKLLKTITGHQLCKPLDEEASINNHLNLTNNHLHNTLTRKSINDEQFFMQDLKDQKINNKSSSAASDVVNGDDDMRDLISWSKQVKTDEVLTKPSKIHSKQL